VLYCFYKSLKKAKNNCKFLKAYKQSYIMNIDTKLVSN